MLLNAIALLCATSAWLVSRHAPQHRPVAIALTICALLDVVRSVVPLPVRVDMALCLGAPVWSRWAYVNAFYYVEGSDAADAGLMWILWALLAAIMPVSSWETAVPIAYLVMPVLGGFAALVGFLRKRAYRWAVTQTVALMLLAGDVAGLLLLVRRDWVHYQAGVVLALVAIYQVWWILRRQDKKRID